MPLSFFEPGYALLRGPLLGREVVELLFDSALIAVGFSFPVAGLCSMADRRQLRKRVRRYSFWRLNPLFDRLDGHLYY